MTESTLTKLYYPNRLGRIILLAMEEIIGRNGVNAVLNQGKLPVWQEIFPANTADKEFEFDKISQIQAQLESSFGPHGGRGLALRIGRACFKLILREYGPEMGFADLAFRTSPMDVKIRVTVTTFADLFNRFTDEKVELIEEPDRYRWLATDCPFCWNRQSDVPVCLLAVGLLQEALYWVSGGKYYYVEETECVAKGDPACAITIDKLPMD